MPDREKVIKGLEWILNDIKENGHYQVDNYEDGIREALVLLKEQEPRVLTLEEVQNDCPDYVYLERSTGWLKCCIKCEGESNKYVGCFVYEVNEGLVGRWEKYGKMWRCWSYRPTEEQREATQWAK